MRRQCVFVFPTQHLHFRCIFHEGMPGNPYIDITSGGNLALINTQKNMSEQSKICREFPSRHSSKQNEKIVQCKKKQVVENFNICDGYFQYMTCSLPELFLSTWGGSCTWRCRFSSFFCGALTWKSQIPHLISNARNSAIVKFQWHNIRR